MEGWPMDPQIRIGRTLSVDAINHAVRQLGVSKDAARREHREAIEGCVAAATADDADPFTVACALDSLLYDWLMAHREDPDSAAIQIPKGHDSDAAMIVQAAGASVRVRSRIDPGLSSPIPTE